MRTTTGTICYREFHEILARSKLHELDSRRMTANEMELDRRVILKLKMKGVIQSCGNVRVDCHRRPTLWGPGENYLKYMKEWGWA